MKPKKPARKARLTVEDLMAVLRQLLDRVAALEKRTDGAEEQVRHSLGNTEVLRKAVEAKAVSFKDWASTLENQMREMADVHLAQNRAALKDVLARLEMIIPSDQEIDSRLAKIADSARSSYDAAGKPYPAHLQNLLDYLGRAK